MFKEKGVGKGVVYKVSIGCERLVHSGFGRRKRKLVALHQNVHNRLYKQFVIAAYKGLICQTATAPCGDIGQHILIVDEVFDRLSRRLIIPQNDRTAGNGTERIVCRSCRKSRAVPILHLAHLAEMRHSVSVRQRRFVITG
jgi:hypothetical protein